MGENWLCNLRLFKCCAATSRESRASEVSGPKHIYQSSSGIIISSDISSDMVNIFVDLKSTHGSKKG